MWMTNLQAQTDLEAIHTKFEIGLQITGSTIGAKQKEACTAWSAFMDIQPYCTGLKGIKVHLFVFNYHNVES